jgi:hypothetical protein
MSGGVGIVPASERDARAPRNHSPRMNSYAIAPGRLQRRSGDARRRLFRMRNRWFAPPKKKVGF